MAKKKLDNGDRVECPYCGRQGKVALNQGGPISVVHRIERGEIASAGSGLTIECDIVIDACIQGVEKIRGGIRSGMNDIQDAG